jgi:hypothetical protein
MAGRERHKVKELEELLQEAERRGFTVKVGKKGRPFKVLCDCSDKHMSMIHRTPGPTLAMRKTNELTGWPCWATGEGRQEAEE